MSHPGGQASDYYNTQNSYQEYQPPQAPPPTQGYQGGEPQGYVGGPPPAQDYQAYAPPQAAPPNQGYQQQYQSPPQGEYNSAEPKYSTQPPTYGQNFSPPQDDKQSFQQTFKIQKPKWNDLWAGLLVSRFFFERQTTY